MIINQSGGSENLKKELSQQDNLLSELEQILNIKMSASEDLSAELNRQDTLIEQITTTLATKAGGSEDLNTELNTQDSLIEQINAALDGKAGSSGGTSIDTCTVNITSDITLELSYITIEDNKMVAKYTTTATGNMNIQCVCGTCIALNNGTVTAVVDDFLFIRKLNTVSIWQVPSEASKVYSITLYSSGGGSE